MPRASQRVHRFVRPPQLQVPPIEAELLAELVVAMVGPLTPRWRQLLGKGDVDKAWGFWSWAAEELLLALCVPRLEAKDVRQDRPLPLAPHAGEEGQRHQWAHPHSAPVPEAAPPDLVAGHVPPVMPTCHAGVHMDPRARTGPELGPWSPALQKAVDMVETRLRRLMDWRQLWCFCPGKTALKWRTSQKWTSCSSAWGGLSTASMWRTRSLVWTCSCKRMGTTYVVSPWSVNP